MPVQRKVFRIEQTAPLASPFATVDPAWRSPSEQREILAELKVWHGMLEQRSAGAAFNSSTSDDSELRQLKSDTDAIQFALNRTKQEIAALHIDTFGPPQARCARELDAVVDSAERATQQILNAAEDIEEAAKTLSASLKQRQELSLALDIQDNVLRIFEACNFQDLSGQRIAKVLDTLKFIEERVAHMVAIWGGTEAFRAYAGKSIPEHDRGTTLHGPKLEGDPGHASQKDVDALFAVG